MNPDATISYSTDGSDPSQTYSGPIMVSTTTTILAKADSPWHTISDVVSATYAIIPITEVLGQRAKGQVDGNVAEAQATFLHQVTGGNLLVVAGTVWLDNGGTTISEIRDTLSTPYTVAEFVSTTDGNYRLFIAYGRAPSDAPPNSVTVTVTTTAAAFCSFGIDEFSGVHPDVPLETGGSGVSGGPDLMPTAPITTGVDNTLIVGVVSVQTHPTVGISPGSESGSNYEEIAEEEDGVTHEVAFHAEFKVARTAGPHDVNWILNAPAPLPWAIYRLSFRPQYPS